MASLALRVGRRALASTPLSTAYAGRANSFGALRFVFAFGVLVAHAAVLGFNKPLPIRVDIPGLSVAGFFGISGFLITRSARRSSLPRYLWHRALRIWPGLWVCLLVTAAVMAPLVWWSDHGTLHGIWRHKVGVFNYLQANWWGGSRQGAIRDVFAGNPYPHAVINGSLWTLAYEITCYLIVAALAVLAVLRRARWLVLSGLVAAFGVLLWNQYGNGDTIWLHGYLPELPLLGTLAKIWFLRYGFMFLAGAAAELFADRLPINDLLGLGALAVVGWVSFHGHLFGPGLLFLEYAILWLAVRLPAILHKVGENDYSYGVYIYAFPVQQLAAKLGVPAAGYWVYLATTAAASFACAWLSWHGIEKRAMRLKNWTPRLPRRNANRPTDRREELVTA